MKGILTSAAAGFMLLSCTAAKEAQQQRADFYAMKGEWRIAHIDHPQGYAIRPFGENAHITCLVGSTWTLIPNNNSGSYHINGTGSCPEVTRNIKYEITPDNDFKFKKIEDGSSAKDNTAGYFLTLQGRTQDDFTLTQNVPHEGEVLRISYHFERVK